MESQEWLLKNENFDSWMQWKYYFVLRLTAQLIAMSQALFDQTHT